jgi:hypothetical protein
MLLCKLTGAHECVQPALAQAGRSVLHALLSGRVPWLAAGAVLAQPQFEDVSILVPPFAGARGITF